MSILQAISQQTDSETNFICLNLLCISQHCRSTVQVQPEKAGRYCCLEVTVSLSHPQKLGIKFFSHQIASTQLFLALPQQDLLSLSPQPSHTPRGLPQPGVPACHCSHTTEPGTCRLESFIQKALQSFQH